MTGLFGDPTTPEAPVALLFFLPPAYSVGGCVNMSKNTVNQF